MANTKITNPELFNLGDSTSATQLPVMTTTQRTAMTDLSTGEMIFNSDTDKVEYFDGTNWYGITYEVSGVVIEYWVIAGGGGAGRDDSFGTKFGGGGGGGILTGTATISLGETLTATTTGQGGNYQTSSNSRGNPGGNTTLSSQTLGTLTADGGGEGGGANSQNGGNGGSGGGGAGSGTGGTAVSGQGNDGGNSQGGNWSAGGGGKAAAGTNTSNGGAGINLTYAKSNNVLATEMFSYGGGSRQGVGPYSAGTNGDGTSADTGRNMTAGVSGEPYRGSGGRWQGGGGNSGSILIKAPIANTYTSTGGIIIATDSNYRYFTLTGTGSTLTIN